MPELPEVETIRRVLEPQLRGRRILRAELLTPGVAAHPAAEDFCRAAGGQAFSAVNRRGKFCCFTWKTAEILWSTCA